jgi:hypothetical protein
MPSSPNIKGYIYNEANAKTKPIARKNVVLKTNTV